MFMFCQGVNQNLIYLRLGNENAPVPLFHGSKGWEAKSNFYILM